ncbi:hypothetical protein HanHA300_Chr16g0608351 [Helianthus annuus]|nr:hypothetical protein HanHA300_Chr16g0608351 [Helianthus annuus]KAJ0460279.1 hypothetical protein HanHA89_Chr16g0658911 [Helianthus annuus]KAJ0640717.1 hypothetical protein HanLR1_Chr16g0618871 [Helianthus annuus]
MFCSKLIQREKNSDVVPRRATSCACTFCYRQLLAFSRVQVDPPGLGTVFWVG